MIHKNRITGEKSCGRVLIDIKDMKHGVYEQKWHDVLYGKKGRGTKVGQIFLKVLLHKEGLTKEQRRSSIMANMEDLASSSDSVNPPGSPGAAEKPWRKIPGGGSTVNSGAPNSSSNENAVQSNPSSIQSMELQIDLETRLQAMEKNMAQVAQMMANVVERVGSIA